MSTETEMDKYPVIVEPFKGSFSMANAILFAGLQVIAKLNITYNYS